MDKAIRQGRCDIKVLYVAGTVTTDITPIVTNVDWSGDMQQAARSLTVGLANTLNGRDKAISLQNGKQIVFRNFGSELFRGVIVSQDISIDGSMTVNCHDTNWYLTKNTETKKFVNKKASDIIRELCKQFSIPYGHIEDTGYYIPKLILESTTLWDMMVTALTYSSGRNGRKFHITNKGGKLELRERKKVVSKWVIEDGKNITGASYSQSIENMYTKVKVVSESEKKKTLTAITKDQSLIDQFGLMQHFESESGDTSQSEINQKAKEILKEHGKVEKTFDLDVLGIEDVVSGGSVYVKQAMTNMLGGYYVSSDNHSFSNGVHTMSVGLTLTDDLPRIEYQAPTNG